MYCTEGRDTDLWNTSVIMVILLVLMKDIPCNYILL